MLIESDGVHAVYDGPCNQPECKNATVSYAVAKAYYT